MTEPLLPAPHVDGCSSAATPEAKASRKAQKHHKGRRQMEDSFMMYMYKVRMCNRTTTHNWKLCPWAHPGETAAIRRHPSCHMAELCPAVRQHQECPHGEGCMYSRNAFECHLHPDRYRTTMCTSGEACTRNICFFAHNEQELRTPTASSAAAQWGAAANGTAAAEAQAQQQLLLQQQLHLAHLAHHSPHAGAQPQFALNGIMPGDAAGMVGLDAAAAHGLCSMQADSLPGAHVPPSPAAGCMSAAAPLGSPGLAPVHQQHQQHYLNQLALQAAQLSAHAQALATQGASGGAGAGMVPVPATCGGSLAMAAAAAPSSSQAPAPASCGMDAATQRQMMLGAHPGHAGLLPDPGSAPSSDSSLLLGGTYSAPLHMALPAPAACAAMQPSAQQQQQMDVQRAAMLLQQLHVSAADVVAMHSEPLPRPLQLGPAAPRLHHMGSNPSLSDNSSQSLVASMVGGGPWEAAAAHDLSNRSISHISNQSATQLSDMSLGSADISLLSVLPAGLIRLEGGGDEQQQHHHHAAMPVMLPQHHHGWGHHPA